MRASPPDDESEQERFRSAFGAALDAQLKTAGLSQTALAARLGTTRSYVNQTISGAKTASPHLAEAVADQLNLSLDERQRLHFAAAIDNGYRIAPLPPAKKRKSKRK